MTRFDILTLFPDIIDSYIKESIIKRAIENNLIEVHVHNFRAFSGNKHSTVDDYAYSGGKGMLIRIDPIVHCLRSIPNYEKATKILTSASGKLYKQDCAKNLIKNNDHFIIICGHYEGIDNRILDYVDYEYSIGDYVLTGGELPSLILLDSISRLIPGVLSEGSIDIESYENNLLEYPQYTRPQEFEGKIVPEVLISGHHQKVEKWKREESIKKTYLNRPDLLEKSNLNKEDLEYLEKIKNE